MAEAMLTRPGAKETPVEKEMRVCSRIQPVLEKMAVACKEQILSLEGDPDCATPAKFLDPNYNRLAEIHGPMKVEAALQFLLNGSCYLPGHGLIDDDEIGSLIMEELVPLVFVAPVIIGNNPPEIRILNAVAKLKAHPDDPQKTRWEIGDVHGHISYYRDFEGDLSRPITEADAEGICQELGECNCRLYAVQCIKGNPQALVKAPAMDKTEPPAVSAASAPPPPGLS